MDQKGENPHGCEQQYGDCGEGWSIKGLNNNRKNTIKIKKEKISLTNK